MSLDLAPIFRERAAARVRLFFEVEDGRVISIRRMCGRTHRLALLDGR